MKKNHVLPFHVEKTFSHAAMSVLGFLLELICMLVFAFPIGFIVGVIVSQFK